MKALNKQTAPKAVAPERIIQFGEGNFLRAFVDWIVYNMNQKTDFNSSVVVVQPIEKGMAEWLNGQDCLYHVNLQGRLNGEAVNSLTRIDCISRALNPYSQNAAFMALADQPDIRFVISNTTEAGIAFDPACKLSDAPASSYPGKLTQLLYRRFKTFKGDKTKGLIIMPCELIFLNGHHLKECIYQYIELWKDDFGADYEKFKTWFTKYCYVCATLVDRIVPGFPRKEIAQIQKKICYADNLVVQAEIFHLWVIEAAENLSLRQLAEEFPANKAGLNVLFVKSEAPYHERKVTLLNGPHTVLSPVAYLSGVNIVRDACNHPVIGKYNADPQPAHGRAEEVCRRRAGALQQPLRGPSGDEHHVELLPKIPDARPAWLEDLPRAQGRTAERLGIGLGRHHHLLQGRCTCRRR